MMEKKKIFTQEDVMALLEKLYEKSINGIPTVSKPIEQLAAEYLEKADSVQKAAKSFNKYQIAKCTTSGFINSFGGILTLPVTIPANIGSVLYIQMRMIVCLAHMGGYDVNSDQVQTLVYACLAGISLDQILKRVGIELGEKFGMALVKKIPGKSLQAINKKVGFRLFTKLGKTGVINIGKMLPVVGGVIGGGFDFVETKVIAKRAYLMFIEGDFTAAGREEVEPEMIDAEFDEVNT